MTQLPARLRSYWLETLWTGATARFAFLWPRWKFMFTNAQRLADCGRLRSCPHTHVAMQIVISPSAPGSDNFLLEITPEDTTETIRSAVAAHLGERSGRVRLVFGEADSGPKARARRPQSKPVHYAYA